MPGVAVHCLFHIEGDDGYVLAPSILTVDVAQIHICVPCKMACPKNQFLQSHPLINEIRARVSYLTLYLSILPVFKHFLVKYIHLIQRHEPYILGLITGDQQSPEIKWDELRCHVFKPVSLDKRIVKVCIQDKGFQVGQDVQDTKPCLISILSRTKNITVKIYGIDRRGQDRKDPYQIPVLEWNGLLFVQILKRNIKDNLFLVFERALDLNPLIIGPRPQTA